MPQLDAIDEELRKRISQRMKDLRIQHKLSQSAVAYEYDKEKQAQNRWERGSRGASIYTINKFCMALGISISDFFDAEIFRSKKNK